ncbi:VENN motif pre-toxin domain-containing protein [Pantoea ananatis]
MQDNLAVQREITALGQQTFDYLKDKEKEEQRNKLKDNPAFNKQTPQEKSQLLNKLDEQTEEKYGIGSKMQIAAQVISGVFSALAGGNASGAVATGAAPLLAQMVRQASGDNDAMRILLHTLASDLIAKAQGGSVAGAVAGGFTAASPGTNDAFSRLFFGKEAALLTADEKQLIANIVTLAGAGVGGAVGGGTGAGSGGSAARTEVENNLLSVQDEKQRQVAKWSLPYIKDADQKAKAVKLVADLDAKDQAFDVALDNACKGLSSAACKGMRQELAVMGQSYDEQMDGQYVGTMGSVYKEGADKIAGQQWQYAAADAKAQRYADVQRIAQNWGVSPETASTLYDTMIAIHTTAAIGGAVYGLKTEAPTAGSIRNVNPGCPGPGRTHNCVNCSIATDATLAGNPASALPINSTAGVPLTVLESSLAVNL